MPAWEGALALPAILPLGDYTAWLGVSTYTAFAPCQLGINTACQGSNPACLGLSACTACTPSQLGGSADWACTVTWLSGVGDAWSSYISFLLQETIKLINLPWPNLLYLDSLTFFINSWHSSIEVVEIMNTSCDLHLSLCLALLYRRLLMDFTLACIRSLSAFLMIFLALCVLTVVFNLMLTGVIPLLIHLIVNIQ